MLEAQQILHCRYQIQDRLGHTGASRQTWLAWDLENNQEPVIVKLLAFNPQMQLEELKLFEREAQVLKALDHPRIPHYRDYFSIDSQVVWFGLVQDYIPGTSLQERLDQGDVLTEEEIWQLAVNMLHILHYLHQQDPPVLHRDIKPSNLILGEDDYIYLVDFGAVQDKAVLTGVTFTVVGTCGYAPLEQFWGRAVPASDLYALGATLIHLLTGIAPADLPQRNGRIQFAEGVKVHPFFTAWLEKLVEPAAENRFSSAQEALDVMKRGELPVPLEAQPRRIQKPQRSKIRLEHTPTESTITIPPLFVRNRFSYGVQLVSTVVLTGGLIGIPAWPELTIFFPLELVFILLMLAIFFVVIFKLHSKTVIRLGSDRLQYIYQTLSIIWVTRNVPVDHILGVLWQRRDTRNYLTLRTATKFIDLYKGLTELECLWLIQELQTWLDRH